LVYSLESYRKNKKVNSLLRRSVLLPVWNVECLMIKKHSGKT